MTSTPGTGAARPRSAAVVRSIVDSAPPLSSDQVAALTAMGLRRADLLVDHADGALERSA